MELRAATNRGWSRREKLAVRRLYLLQGVSPKEIAEKLDRDPASIHCLISRQGWAKLRRQKEAEAAREAELQATDAAKEFVESVSVQAQEMTERGFDFAREANDAKEFAFAMSGTKTAVQLARTALALDGPGAALGSGAQPIAVVFGAFPHPQQPERLEKNVTPDASGEALDFA